MKKTSWKDMKWYQKFGVIYMIFWIFDIVQYIKSYFLARKAGKFDHEDKKEMNFFGIDVVYWPARLGNAIYAGVSNNILGKGYTIYVDKLFLNLSDNAKKFVLYHELGHVENGDLKGNFKHLMKMGMLRSFPFPANPSTIREFKADDNALKYMSKADCISAINELMDLQGVSKLEFYMRRKNLLAK